MNDNYTMQGLPSQDRPDSEKDADYIADYLMAMDRSCASLASQGLRNGPRMMDGVADSEWRDNTGAVRNIWQDHHDVDLNYRWMFGLMSGRAWKGMHSPNAAHANEELAAGAVNLSIPALFRPYINQLLTAILRRDLTVTATVFDAEAMGEVERKLAVGKARMVGNAKPMHQAAFAALGIQDDMKLPEGHPTDETSYTIWGKSVKSTIAMDVEKVVDVIQSLWEFERLVMPLLAQGLVASGTVVLYCVTMADGLPRPMWADRRNCIIPPTDNNWQNPQLFGVYRDMYPHEIFREAGKGLDEADRKRIYELAASPNTGMGNTTYTLGSLQRGNVGTVRVLCGWFMDSNHMGEDNAPYQVVYYGCVIPGTGKRNSDGKWEERPIKWSCGPAYNQVRMKSTLGLTRLPVVLKASGMYANTVKPVARVAMDCYDNFVRLHLKMVHLINKMRASGFFIDTKQLTYADKSGNLMKPSQVMESLINTGVALANTVDTQDHLDVNGRKQNPLQFIEGYMPEFNSIAGQMDRELVNLQRALAIPEAVLGQIRERDAKANVEVQFASQDGTQAYLTDPVDDALSELALIVYGQVQAVLSGGHAPAFERLSTLMGDEIPTRIARSAGAAISDMAIRVREGMDSRLMQLLTQMVVDNVKIGKIKPGMGAYILQNPNNKQAWKILDDEIEKADKVAHERQMQLVQEQGQQNQQAGQITAQSEQQIEAARMQQEAETLDKKIAHEERLAAMKSEDLHTLSIDAQSAKIDALSRQLQSALDLFERKAEHERDMQRRDLESKERIAEDANETSEEIAEEARKAAASRPKTGK